MTGIAAAAATGIDPTDMVVFNNEVLFNGVDTSGLSGLWVTNGTVDGTHELVAGAGGALDPSGLNPTDLTVFNGQVLFSGLDASGDMGLWVTNGTVAGTQELTGIKGADPSGLAPSDLTVYNGEVLFRGLDQSGRPQLWVTNGTAIGTHELTGIVGAATTSVGFDPSGFTLYNGVVLFNGVDSSGHSELWKTNGTAAGTIEVNPIAGTQSIGLSPVDLTALNQASSNGILFQNTGGQASIWNVTGAILTGGGAVTPNPGPSWKAIGTGDFYGEGNSDILCQNAKSGQVSIWEMNGSILIGGGACQPQSRAELESDRNGRFQ